MSDPDNTAAEKLSSIMKRIMIAAWIVIAALIIYGLMFGEKELGDPPLHDVTKAQLSSDSVIAEKPENLAKQVGKAPVVNVEETKDEKKADKVTTPAPVETSKPKKRPVHKKVNKTFTKKEQPEPYSRKGETGRKTAATTAKKPSAISKKWFVRFAVCRLKESCGSLRRKLSNRGIETFIVDEVVRFPNGTSRAIKLFYTNSFPTKKAARKKALEFKNSGVDCTIELRSG